MDVTLFISHSLTVRHLGCSHVLAIMHKAALNNPAQVSTRTFSGPLVTNKQATAGSYSNRTCSFVRNASPEWRHHSALLPALSSSAPRSSALGAVPRSGRPPFSQVCGSKPARFHSAVLRGHGTECLFIHSPSTCASSPASCRFKCVVRFLIRSVFLAF